MDKGAHFYSCDFQVHSPRDINWNGSKPTDNEDRREFAKELIKACRKKGLDAIAITDHHDLVFYKYIKWAAKNEVDESGEVIEGEKQLTIFPGIELSLSNPPCQALLILDANFPIDQFPRILSKLSINPSPDEDEYTAEVENISSDVVNNLNDLHTKLDTIDVLKGKYVVLPHVSDGGHKTLLRAGFAEHYKNMPCVGGYLDGSVEDLGQGNQNILSGRDQNYGNKRLGLFQTSDSRREDFADLGTHSTWVKWSEPTAEALRQACLAQESRISQKKPEIPQIHITNIDVTNSKFLGSFSVEFNNQYNALIGGRGTGKSTILEYLRWGLCDQAPSIYSEENLSELKEKRKRLIDNTLRNFDGEVRVTFEKNGIKHIVKRSSSTNEIQLKIGDNIFRNASENEIRQVLPIQAYSQKQLSSVGVKTEELKRFIQQPIANELKDLRFQIHEVADQLKNSYSKLVRKKEIESEVEQYELETESVNSQIDNLKESLTGLSEEDQETIESKKKYDLEQSIVKRHQKEIERLKSEATQLQESIYSTSQEIENSENLENSALIEQVMVEKERIIDELKDAIDQLTSKLSDENTIEFRNKVNEWQRKRENFLEDYEEAKEKASDNKQQIKEIQSLEDRLSEINNILESREEILKNIGAPERDFNDAREKWNELHFAKINLFDEQAKNLNQLSDGLVNVDVTKNIDIESIQTLLSKHFTGTRIREDRIINICDSIIESEAPLQAWNKVLRELKELCELKIIEEKNPEIPKLTLLDQSGLNETNKKRIIEELTTDDWINIATFEIDLHPEFKYITNNELGDEIPFSEASAGQQATALLTMLLNQPGTPLLIDQPEDDIDNRAINQIISRVWNSKQKRQLIFTSHNANLVVNGDAELVICCDYRDASDQTRGKIKEQGAIDKNKVRDEITSVMEGGEKAFKLRKQKYGF